MPEVVYNREPERGQGLPDKGFTLVEILLAVSLLSIIVTVMYSAFNTTARIMRRTERTKGTYQFARLIMSRMGQDLGSAYFSPTRKNFVFRGEDIKGYDFDGDALTFITAGHVMSRRNAPEGDLAEISYYLDENNPGILIRREDLSPDDELETGGVLDVLGKNVLGLNFTYLDGTEEAARTPGRTQTQDDIALEEKKAWKEEWDSDESPYLPRAVKIDMSLVNEEGKVEDFSTTVVLAMGRTPTSSQPTVAPGTVPAAAPSGSSGRRPTPPVEFRPGGRGGRSGPPRGDTGGEGRNRWQRPGSGTRPSTPEGLRQDGGGSGTRSPGTPTIQRRPSNASGGVRPPAPSGGR